MPLAAFPKCFLESMCVEKKPTLDEWIAMAADNLDVDGLEFFFGFTPTDPAELKRVRNVLDKRKLQMPMMCYSPDFTRNDAKERAAEIEKEKKVIEITAALGGKFCRVLSGQRRPDVTRKDGVRYAVECITQLIPFAEKHRITLILENHYKDGFWTQPEFAQKMDVFLELLAAIPPSPWFGVNYDPSNTVIAGEDPIAMLEAVKTRVVTMHASDRYFEGGTVEDLQRIEAHPQAGYAQILKHGVVGKGLNDYDKIFSILKGAGFKGWVSIEDGQDPAVGMDHLKQSAVFLRQKMKQHGLN